MIKSRSIYLSRLLLVFAILNFSSCSKDSDDPIAETITVSTSDFSVTMDENPTKGQIIGTVSGSTNQGTVSFSITEQNPSGAFSIDATSGELKVADESLFDFETNPIITGTVKVANGAVFKNAAVTIALNDLEEDKIYEGDVWIAYQEDLNNFGSMGYTHITGFLRIGNPQTGNIYDLTPLASIKNIDGNLEIKNVKLLTSLDGLENLESVGGDLRIFGNHILINVKALSQLTIIHGKLDLSINLQLADHTGLHNISTVNGDFILESNLTKDITGLSGITSVGGDFLLASALNLRSLDLNNIKNIGGNLEIYLTQKLTNIDFLSNLNTVGGNLRITSNDGLTDLCGLRPLLQANMLEGTYIVKDNGYNPTKQDIIDGDCAL